MSMRTAITLAAAILSVASVADAQTYAIADATVLMTGSDERPGRMTGATIIVRDGEIVSVGRDPGIPAGAEVIDAKGGTVTPGLFAALSGIGLEEIGLNGEGNDRSARGDTGLSVSYDAADGFYADTSIIPINRAGGVTRAYVAPDTGFDLFGGCGMAITLAPAPDAAIGEGRITERCLAQTVDLGYAGARSQGDSRVAAMARLKRALDDADAYDADLDGYNYAYEKGRLAVRDAAALVPVLKGAQKMLVHVEGASDILRVLDLAEEYGLDIVLAGAAEAHRVADAIAAAGVPVIMDPLQNLPGQFESFGATLTAAGILEEAGVTVAFYDADIGYTHNLRNMRQLAGNAVANGMTYAGALAAITENPAKIWGQADVGRIAPGMTADLVLWDGDPLELMTLPVAVMIDGEPVSLDNRQKALTDRYRDLTRGERPIAYRD